MFNSCITYFYICFDMTLKIENILYNISPGNWRFTFFVPYICSTCCNLSNSQVLSLPPSKFVIRYIEIVMRNVIMLLKS